MLFICITASAEVKIVNSTDILLGVRLIEQGDRSKEVYKLINPGMMAKVQTKSFITISAQLITGSYEINCCEWLSVSDGRELIISLSNQGKSCRCKLQ